MKKQAKNKILIQSIAFSPDSVSTAYLYNDLATGLRGHGFEVVVITTTPHYNALPEELAKQPLSRRFGGLFFTSSYKGIRVYHIPQKKFKSALLRMLGFIYWHILSLTIGWAQRNVALVIAPSPPLTIGIISLLIAKPKGAKAVYNVQEIYPDFLINQGLKSKPVIGLLKWMERAVYDRSDAVVTIDEVFYNTIAPRFRDSNKLHIIPNFVDTDVYKPVDDLSELDPHLFPADDVLKVMYAGNIGYAQDWEPLIAVARSMRNEPVGFWVIGEGVMKEKLQESIRRENLTNIHLVPYQPRHMMAKVVCYADIHFIFMSPEMDGQGFPSKVYTIMACKKPLLVMSQKQTPLAEFLKNKSCAFVITEKAQEEKSRQAEDILLSLIRQPGLAANMGATGYEVIQQHYSKEAVVNQYVGLCKQLTGHA